MTQFKFINRLQSCARYLQVYGDILNILFHFQCALFKQEESLDADVAALQLLLSPFALLKDTDSNSKYIKTDKLKE